MEQWTNCVYRSAAQSQTISKRRKFVADGVFYAELNEFFTRELAEEGYSGVEVRVTPTVTDISTLPRTAEPDFPASNRRIGDCGWMGVWRMEDEGIAVLTGL